MSEKVLEVNSRVRDIKGSRCLGVIKEIREEIVGTSGDTTDKAVLIKILWDNGTFSYISEDAIEVVSKP